MALGRHPKITYTVWTERCKTGMGFDVALVRLFGLITLLNNDVGFRKSSV